MWRRVEDAVEDSEFGLIETCRKGDELSNVGGETGGAGAV